MRYIFALILLLPAGLSLADTENRVAISEERVQSELTVLSNVAENELSKFAVGSEKREAA